MKKIAYLIQLLAVTLLFSSVAFAHDRDWGRHGHDGGHSQGHHGWGGYPRQRVNNYYQQQPAYYQSRPQYHPPQPQFNNGGLYYDNRSHQGLAGGVVGNVLGYELGNGHPLAAALGAAAGSFLGNGLGRNY